MSRPFWFVGFVTHAVRTAPWLARATRWPIVGPFLRAVLRLLTRHDDAIYLPKDGVITLQAPIPAPESLVLPSRIVEHFVRQASYRWIMNTCLCRRAAGCRDYPIDLGCLFVGEAARQIHPALGHEATEEEALAHVARARELGLVHMIGRHTFDSHWLGARPADRLMTICSCCPCCCIIGELQHVPAHINHSIGPMPGVSVQITERCMGCGVCTQGVCFTNAIALSNGTASISGLCVACGRCVESCPHGAIELRIDSDRYVEATIRRLERKVNVR